MNKEKEYDEMDVVKEERERGTKVRKTRAGFEPYQVKKSRSVLSDKAINPGEKDKHKQKHNQPSSAKRSSSVGKHGHVQGSDKQDKLDSLSDTKLPMRVDQKSSPLTKFKSNNSNSSTSSCSDDNNSNSNSNNSSSCSSNNFSMNNSWNSNKSSSNSTNTNKKSSINRQINNSNNSTDIDNDITMTTSINNNNFNESYSNGDNNNNNSNINSNINSNNSSSSNNKNNNHRGKDSRNVSNASDSVNKSINSTANSTKNNNKSHNHNDDDGNDDKNTYNNNYNNSYTIDNNSKQTNWRSHINKEKPRQYHRKKVSNENLISLNDRLNRRKSSHGSSDVNSYQANSDICATGNSPSQNLDLIDNSYHLADNHTGFKAQEMRQVILEKSNNKYKDGFHYVSAQDLTGSESIIVSQKQVEILEEPEHVCCTPEQHCMTKEEITLIKKIDHDKKIRGLGILECPCLLGLDGERLGFCNAHDLIADHNLTKRSSLSPGGNEEMSVAESRKSYVGRRQDEIYDEGTDHLVLDVNMADLDLSKDGFSNMCNKIDNQAIRLKPNYNTSLSVDDVELERGENIPSCLDMPHSDFDSSGVQEYVPLSQSSQNLDATDVEYLLSLKQNSSLVSDETCEGADIQPQLTKKMFSESPNSTKQPDKMINRNPVMSKSDTCLLTSEGKSPEYRMFDAYSCPSLLYWDVTWEGENTQPQLTRQMFSRSPNGAKQPDKTNNSNPIKSKSDSSLLSPESKSPEYHMFDAYSCPTLFYNEIHLHSNVVTCSPSEQCIEFIAPMDESNILNDSLTNTGDLLEKDDLQMIENVQNRVLDDNSVDIENDENLMIGEGELNCKEQTLTEFDREENTEKMKTDIENIDDRFNELDSHRLIDIFDSEEREKLSEQNNNSKSLSNSLHPMKDPPSDSGKTSNELKDFCAGKPGASSSMRTSELSVKISSSNRRQVRLSHHTFDGRFTTTPKHDDDSYMVREYMNTIKDKQFQLKKLLQRGFQSLESVNVMLAMSEAIQQKFGELIVHNQEYSFRHNFENSLWKLAFYSIIAKFRLFLEDQNVPHSAIQKIGVLYWDFLQNGIQFLDAIIVQLQKQASFDLNSYLKDPIKISSCNKQVKFALRSCHLLLIFMGDLERYVSQFLQEDDYHNAKRYYKQAQILTPKNGKSYNQLAVIAVVTKHKLDAVYYYARSLQVSIPFLTAKDRLTAIFQEIQKKANKLKLTRIKRMTNISTSTYTSCTRPDDTSNRSGMSEQNEYCNHNQISMNQIGSDSHDRTISGQNDIDYLREEVWIFHRKNMKKFTVMLTKQNEIIDLTSKPSAKEETSMKFSLNEINRTYMILFLFVHCKLYTNIGLEEFTYIHQETLSDLTTILCHPKASSIRKENLLKCIVINIFSVHNIMEKNGHEDVIPNTALDLAITFGMDMIGVLSKHCVELLDKDIKQLSKADQFLPAIRVWLQWLITHSELVKKSSVSSMLDIWSELCNFFNKIISFPHDKSIVLVVDGNENSYLEEDMLMAGLKSLNNSLLFCSPEEGFESRSVSELRLRNMKELVKQLDKCGNLPFTYDAKEHTYKPVVSTRVLSTSPEKKAKDLDICDEVDALDDVIIEDDDEEDMSHISELKTQKAALTKKVRESENARKAAMEVLESHRLQGRHLSENCPTFLVADTNCYIDQLGCIDSILRSQDFTLVVPLVVINELDGLKKGFYFDPNKFHEHQRKVQQCAQLAIKFLEDEFSRGGTNLRAMTSNGNELDTILFRAEEFSKDRGTNDDIILSCCLRYCKEYEVDTVYATRIISREVALLTSDRNLRLKAHARVVPTVDILTFMKMARFL